MSPASLSPGPTITIASVSPAPPTGVPARRLHRGRMLAVLLAAPFMAQADATIANAATPSIRVGLGASGAALELVIGGYPDRIVSFRCIDSIHRADRSPHDLPPEMEPA